MTIARLGDPYQDILSDFVGIAIGRAEYLSGVVMVQLVARSKDRAIPLEWWVPEDRVAPFDADTASGSIGFRPRERP